MLKCLLSECKVPDNKIKRMCDQNELIKLTRNLYETDTKIPGYKFVAKKPHACVWDESHISLDIYLEKWYIIFVY